jgi:transposase
MKVYAGIDLHSNNHVVVLSDADGKEVYRKRISNDLEKALSVLAPYQSQIEGVAVESTYNWYWLVDGHDGSWLSGASGQYGSRSPV